MFQSAPRILTRGDWSASWFSIRSKAFQSAPRILTPVDTKSRTYWNAPGMFQSAPRILTRGDVNRGDIRDNGLVSIRPPHSPAGRLPRPGVLGVHPVSFNPRPAFSRG